jgi:hypothetical protein
MALMQSLIIPLFVAALTGLIAQGPASAPAWPLRIEPIATPAGAQSGQPQLTVSSRGVLLSWIERTGDLAALKFSERTADGWTLPRTAASGNNWFINWADVPSVARLQDGTLVAHWLQKSGADTYAYDVRLSHSTDEGKTWSSPITPHHDGTKTEHGFASLFQVPGAGLGLSWLDGRAMTPGDHGGAGGHGTDDMSLRVASFGLDWNQIAEEPLDLRVCECCPTAVAVTSDGPIVAYRDRSPEEIRDIYVSRLENGKWTKGVAVHQDGWRINACPVNGPSLSARGQAVAIAWFQAKDDKPKAFAAFSSDSGRSFGRPIRLDEEASLGRVDVELLTDGSAVAAHVEYSNQRAHFRIRRVDASGTASQPVTVSSMAANRASGYPRMAQHNGELIFAWTDREGGSQVRVASARVPGK